MGERVFQRMPYVVEVAFRTASSFLVAYSVNLSRGGLFLATDDSVAIGTVIKLCFTIPGAGAVEVDGRVAWRRNQPSSPHGPPAGYGIQFEDLDHTMGEIIDRLVGSYQGIAALILCGDEQEAAVITRMVHAVIASAEITSAFDLPTARHALDREKDIVILVADEPFALDVIALAKHRNCPVPVVAMTSSGRAGQHASARGADEVIANPPLFHDFQAALVRALGRPLAIR